MKVRISSSSFLLTTIATLLLTATITHAQSISVNKACTKVGETFSVTFQNINPVDTDWIGIIPANENTNSFNSIGMWVWTCGSKTCDGAVGMGRVRMRASNMATGTWRAVLARDAESGPFTAYAVSSTFTIATTCGQVTTPVAAPTTANANVKALGHINSAKDEIKGLINNDKTLSAQFLRMGFHDCIGGCDGCIDLDNPDNAGLEPVIDILQPIVDRHAKNSVSRADIWALATTVGADVAQPNSDRVDLKLKWWGRTDCEKTGTQCLGDNGSAVTCSSKKGPHHEFPNNNMHTHELYSFFKDNFGFNQRDTVTIMGAHTIGVVREEDFGFAAPNGWVLNNDQFNNQYYGELVGGDSPNDSVDILINDAPAWRRAIIKGVRHWAGFPEGQRIIMLNTDMALVRTLDSSNLDQSNGRVSCTFEDNSATETLKVCPHVEGALQIAAEFKNDNRAWLRAFDDVLTRMLSNGYKRNSCNDAICQLRK